MPDTDPAKVSTWRELSGEYARLEAERIQLATATAATAATA